MTATAITANKILAVLFAAYPIETRNVPGEDAMLTAKVYASALDDLDGDEVSRAITFLIKTSERLPTVAKIRLTVLDLRHGPARPGGDAWGDVTREIARRGLRGEAAFADPLVAKAVSRFGWSDLCRSENPAADRARFIELYDALCREERHVAAARPNAHSELLSAARRPDLRPLGAGRDRHRLGDGA